MSSSRLQDKVAAITGGSSGIGLAVAREFADAGARVTVMARSREKLQAVEADVKPIRTFQGDVTREEDLEAFFKSIDERHRRLDVLVANAGIGMFRPIEDVTPEDFDRLVDVNFKGVFFTVKKALPYLSNGASVILVSSNAHLMGVSTGSVYCATKAAVRSLARTLSAELLPARGIRVNCLSPGPTETGIFEGMGMPRAQLVATKEYMKKMVPLGRLAAPREMATVALFLASAESSFIVGEDIVADGGWTAL